MEATYDGKKSCQFAKDFIANHASVQWMGTKYTEPHLFPEIWLKSLAEYLTNMVRPALTQYHVSEALEFISNTMRTASHEICEMVETYNHFDNALVEIIRYQSQPKTCLEFIKESRKELKDSWYYKEGAGTAWDVVKEAADARYTKAIDIIKNANGSDFIKELDQI